jgi:hypothetical protein
MLPFGPNQAQVGVSVIFCLIVENLLEINVDVKSTSASVRLRPS